MVHKDKVTKDLLAVFGIEEETNNKKEKDMRSPEQVIEAIRSLFAQYDEKYPDDKGFADTDIAQLIRRTKARRRSDFLDDGVDALVLTDAEIEAYEKHQSDANSKKMEALFDTMIEAGDVPKAEYILNNMKNHWDMEKRKAMAKKIGESYDIDPVSGLLDTVHGIKKAAKERARQQAE